jgi:hypothetical protein
MHFIRTANVLAIAWGLFLVNAASIPAYAGLELILDVELRGVYEDNVVGILSDQQQASVAANGPRGMTAAAAGQGPGGSGNTSPYLGSNSQAYGDYSLVLAADVGFTAPATPDTALFIIGSLENTSYSRYSDFNSTIAGVNAGFVMNLGPVFLLKPLVFARIKEFGDPERNGNSYGGMLELKQRLSPHLSLREAYEFEKNHAATAYFSYTGHAGKAGLGYAFGENWMLNLGYTHLIREYEEPSGFAVTSQRISADIRKSFLKHWRVIIGYAQELSSENLSNTRSIDNIYSASLLYSY